MNFLCPACRTPLPRDTPTPVVPCTACGVEVDVSRLDTAPGAAPLRADVDLEGATLGGFRLGRRLGAGGMGVVYEAEGDGGPCAVKVLAGLLAADPSLRARFRREASALRAVEHPGVVRVLADGEERGFCWYAMERVNGSDLRARLQQGPLAPADVERLARRLLEALVAVHARGFVHRDIKPGNVLLTADGAPKLCDFGIAQVDGATTLTATAAVLGSLRYMAPEQRRGLALPQSDLYSLGVTLHEALAGGVPDEKPIPRGVPRRLRGLVHALLADRAIDRPSSAAAALAWLEPRPALRRRVAIAAAIALVAGGAIAFAIQREPPVLAEATFPKERPIVAAKEAPPSTKVPVDPLPQVNAPEQEKQAPPDAPVPASTAPTETPRTPPPQQGPDATEKIADVRPVSKDGAPSKHAAPLNVRGTTGTGGSGLEGGLGTRGGAATPSREVSKTDPGARKSLSRKQLIEQQLIEQKGLANEQPPEKKRPLEKKKPLEKKRLDLQGGFETKAATSATEPLGK